MELQEIINKLNEVNFTAIDVETANEKRASICSVGIVSVHNGTITSKKRYLVRPREFRFTEVNKRLHGIGENDVVNEPEFNVVWEQVHHLLENQILLAHNASFDVDAISQTLNGYNLGEFNNKFICTQKLAQEAFLDLENYRLSDVAEYLGLDCRHHDCVSDATVAAEIGIRAIPLYNKNCYTFSRTELTHDISKRGSVINKNSYLSSFDEKKINSSLLKPNLNSNNIDNPFYNKVVVFTGDMKLVKRQVAAGQIQRLGADINTSISKRTQIVIIGAGAGPSKMKKIEDLVLQGCNIRMIYEEEFISLTSHY